jgi:hypothetical protein
MSSRHFAVEYSVFSGNDGWFRDGETQADNAQGVFLVLGKDT